VAVVEPGGLQPFEEHIGAFEVNAASASDGDVSERGREEGLADTDWTEDHDVVGCVNEPE